MPIYQLLHSGIPLTPGDRHRIARAITDIHHSETNAPEPFVRVVFTPLPLGTIYIAGEVAPSIALNCGIRAGRSEATRQRIVQRCYDLLAEVTQAPPDQIFVMVTEAPSAWIMEAGFFLPEPTDEAEAAWIQQLQQTYPGRYDDWSGGQRPTDGVADSHRSHHRRTLAAQTVLELDRVAGLGTPATSNDGDQA